MPSWQEREEFVQFMREALSKPHAQRMLTKIPTKEAFKHAGLPDDQVAVLDLPQQAPVPRIKNGQCARHDLAQTCQLEKNLHDVVSALLLAGPSTDCKRLEQQGGINGSGIRTAPGAPSVNGC